MELQVGVKILLQNKEGKFLVLQRNLEKYPEISKDRSLDIPGGRIEKGVPLIENLKREVKEETGLDLKDAPRLLIAQDILKTDKHVVRLTYVGSVEGEPILSEEHSSYLWLSKDELKNKQGLDSYTIEAISKL
jgi:8-oxo-dGTP pyrophosphatase MutT (NUDIX family)